MQYSINIYVLSMGKALSNTLKIKRITKIQLMNLLICLYTEILNFEKMLLTEMLKKFEGRETAFRESREKSKSH